MRRCIARIGLRARTSAAVILAAFGVLLACQFARPTRAADQSAARHAPASVLGEITGVVMRGSDRRPVAGATVVLIGGYDVGQEDFPSATSDTAGRFRFQNVPTYPLGYQATAHLGNLICDMTPVAALRPTTDSRRSQDLQGSPPPNCRYLPLRLEMIEGEQVKFLVVSKATGKPLPGARVIHNSFTQQVDISDERGIALCSGLDSGWQNFEITCDGFARQRLDIDLSDSLGIESRKVELEPGGTIRGVLVDSAGNPLPGVSGLGDGPTDRTGKFLQRFVPFNTPIQLYPFTSDVGYWSPLGTVTLTPNNRLADLRLVAQLVPHPRIVSIAGSITGKNGRPIAGAEVVANPGTISERPAKTDVTGKFHFGTVEVYNGAATVVVTAKRYAPRTVKVTPAATETFAAVNVQLEPGHSVHGRVVDEYGKPLAGIGVVLNSRSYPFGFELSEYRWTDEEGRFELDSLPDDVQFDLTGPDELHISNIRLKRDQPGEMVYTIPSHGTLRGQVVDAETGKPVRLYRVRADSSADSQPDDSTLAGNFAKWSGTGRIATSDGRFEISPVIYRSALSLVFEAAGYERNIISRAIALHAGDAPPLKIALMPLHHTDDSALHGQLLDYRGKPAAGAEVRLITCRDEILGDGQFQWTSITSGTFGSCEKPVEQFLSAKTDRAGRFEFKTIQPDRYLQLAYWGNSIPHGRWTSNTKTVSRSERSIAIKLPQPASVVVTFDRAKFPNANGALFRVFPFDRATFPDVETANRAGAVAPVEYSFQFDAKQSKFEIHNSSPGDYSLCICAPGKRIFSATLEATLLERHGELAPGENKVLHFAEPDKKP